MDEKQTAAGTHGEPGERAQGAPRTGQQRTVRQVHDARVLAVMAHPLRRRLMDMLRVSGPATASMLAERTGEAVGNISHHLRVLGTSGLIEEAPELARDRRERWWRPAHTALSWSSAEFADNPADAAIADAAASLNLDYQVGMARSWFAAPQDKRARWSEAAFSADRWLRLRPEELARFSLELVELLNRWSSQHPPQDGGDDPERETVFVFAYGMPGQP